MNIRKVPESAGNSYFKDLNVCYWQGSTYNNSTANKMCQIDIDLGIPLLDEASNYVCAVERLELSGGNIAYYDSSLETYLYNADAATGPSVMILYQNLSRLVLMQEIVLRGKYYSLPHIIQEINRKLQEDDITYINFSIEMGGAISVNFLEDNPNAVYFPNVALGFKGTHLASLFGLPEDPAVATPGNAASANAAAWNATYADPNSTNYRFITNTSRIDCGYIPSLILLRSNLPLESDQTDNSKVNIVTDFSITATSDVAASYLLEKALIPTPNVDVVPSVNNAYTSGIQGGGTIVYVPNERRWLNFSAPIPIYNIRLWIDIVYNDSSTKTYYLPPGGVFRVKFGFYQRE